MKKGSKNNPGIRPLGDKVLVKPLSDEELGTVSAAGIIIPDTVDREKADRGMVIAVGEGKFDDTGRRIPLSVEPGERVVFQWGDKLEFEGEEYYLVSENNILAVLEK